MLWALVAAWAAGITYLSSLTPERLPEMRWEHADKLSHFAAFAVGGFLTTYAVRWSFPMGWGLSALLAVTFVALFGVLDEVHQIFVPGRSGADVGDWIADFLGALAGSQCARLFHAILRRLRPGAPPR